MTAADVIQLIVNYHVNVLSCESSQMIQIVHFISTLPKEHRDNVKLDKIIYTSEGLTPSQRSQIREVLGPIKICSILGSAEAGPYAVGCPHLTGSVTSMYEDFIFDTRLTRIEILPPSFSENDDNPKTLEQGQQGVIAQTSLTRLRNPLVRYITGDVGSLHPLPEASRSQIPEADWEHLRVLRFQGRDRRFSFEWDGNYFEFDKLNTMMSDSQSRVLQWQIVLDRMEPSNEGSLEIRILYAHTDTTSKQAFLEQIETFFHVFQGNCHRFKLVFVDHLSEFERSSTGRKVIKFVNKYN